MSDDLISTHEKRVLASLLGVDGKIIFARYSELLSFYTEHKLSKALVILPLVCHVSGRSVELPKITPNNYVRFEDGSLSDDIKIVFERLVRVNALQVSLVTRDLSNEKLARKFVTMHLLACHASNSMHYLNISDYQRFPLIIRILMLYNVNPAAASGFAFGSD